MRSMVIGGIILIIALMAGTYFIVGDSFVLGGDDDINNLTMLGGLAIITITVFVALKYVNQIKNDKATGELAEENWDGIGEYKNNIPVGWGIIFIALLIWQLWYFFIGYPTNQFSQIGQYNEETLEYNAKFESKWQNATEDELVAMGESLYLVQCSPCHGIDGSGIAGKAHDLTQRISAEQVEYVIKNGANHFTDKYPAGMPAGLLTDDADIQEISEYVANGMTGEAPSTWATCSACHGENGEGMAYVGPNIKDYDQALMNTVLDNGKEGLIGIMPAFKGRLNEVQYNALGAYIRSIGE